MIIRAQPAFGGVNLHTCLINICFHYQIVQYFFNETVYYLFIKCDVTSYDN